MGLAGASQALAHVPQGQTQGLLTGLAHPLSGLDHMLAMIAVGLWGAQLGPPALWLLPVTFPLVMSIGGFLAQVGVRVPGVEVGVALSALLLGLMVAFEAKPKLPLAAALVAVFAIFHGHAHGSEMPLDASGFEYGIGFMLATSVLHAAGFFIGMLIGLSTRVLGYNLYRLAGGLASVAGLALLLGYI